VLVPGGVKSTEALAQDGYAVHFVTEAYKDAKAVAAFGTGRSVLDRAELSESRQAGEDDAVVEDLGVITSSRAQEDVPEEFVETFAQAIARHRTWGRRVEHIPA
jgi:catalase